MAKKLVRAFSLSKSTNEIHETMKFDHKYIEFLQHVDLRARLKIRNPLVVASFGKRLGQIDITGPAAQVKETRAIIREQISKICERQLTVTECEVVYNIVAKNCWDEYFTRQLGKANITAKVCVGASRSVVSILASSQRECDKAYEILLEVLKEKIFSVGCGACSLQSVEFQSLISRLQRGRLIQIAVDLKDNSIKFLGREEEILRATKEISEFIYDKVDRDSVTYKPRVSKSIWEFLASQIDHNIFGQIEKDLKQFFVSIKITDNQEQFLLSGSSESIEQCTQRLSVLAATVVESQKLLQYPGVQKLFRDLDSVELLQKIEKEMCVKIEIEQLPVLPQRSLSLYDMAT